MKMTAAIKQFERWGDENRRLVSILILVSAFFVILYGINQLTESVVVYANDNPNAIAAEENIDNFGLIGEIFRKHDKYLSLRTLIKDVFRVMWWWMIKLVYILVSGLESLLESVLTFYSFIEQLKEHNFYTNLLSIVIASLTAATLAWIGLKMILNHGNPPRIKSVGINLAISFLMIIGLPTMMAWGQEFVEIVWSTDPSSEETQISLQVVKDNIYDMRIPFDVEGNAEEKIESLNRFLDPEQTQPSERNGINDRETLDMIEELEYFPIDEVADIFPGSKDDNILLRSKVTTVLDENGDYTLEAQEVDGPGFIAGLIGVVEDLVDTGYYRYHWNGWRIILTLLALGLAFLFVLFSMAKIYIELGFKLFLAPIVFATDLETGQKTKKVFSDLIISFLTLAFEMISFRMFTVFFSFIGEFSDNFFLYIVGLVAGVIVLMEGSKTLLRWFGVDTGLQEGRGMFGTLIRWSGARALTEKAAGFARKATGSSSHSSNKDSSRSSRENLSENREENLDINKDKEESGLVRDIARKTDKAAKGLSKAAGYGKERGLSGLARDTADLGRDTVGAVGDYAKDKYTLARDAISNGIGAIQNSYSSGQTSAQDKGLEELNEAVEESANVLVGDIPETSEAYQGTLSEVSEQQQSSTGSQHQETASSVETDERERQVNVREQENVESGQISDEEALHQIRSQAEDINLSDPEDVTRQIEHLVNDSNLSDEQKQTVTQELQKAADMIPPEAEQRINQVLASAVTMMATQSSEQATSSSPQVRDEVKQIRENVQEATFSDPQDDIRRISEQVEQSNLSTEQKQQITQNLQKAADMQPQQAQQHVQQVMNKAQAQMDTPQETVQRLRQETQQATFEN
ncbi:pLS20_p028 family conjugation system transmembrane protein, partial [Dolosigranulum pigrum]